MKKKHTKAIAIALTGLVTAAVAMGWIPEELGGEQIRQAITAILEALSSSGAGESPTMLPSGAFSR